MPVNGKRLLGFVLLLGCGCKTFSREEFDALQRVSLAIARARKDYVVQPGDHVKVSVWRGGVVAPEYNQEVTVQPDGKITLINLERPVDTRGLTVHELQARVHEAYYPLFAAGQGAAGYRATVQFLTSDLTQWTPDQVYVCGEVKKASAVPYRRGMTALQAITVAQHLQYTADESRIIIMRQTDEGKTVTREMDLWEVIRHEADDVEVFPGDIIYVPLSGIAIVNLWVEFYIRNMLPINPSFVRSLALGIGP
jgi:protein involved in polysaccharide export with SLBB domain